MSKKSKKQRKAEREASRAAARKAERQRNMATVIIIAIVVALGGLLIWVSLDDEPDVAELLDQFDEEAGEFDEPQPVEPQPSPEPPPDPAEDDRPIACDAELPERAGETKPTHPVPDQVIEAGVAYEAVIETSCGTVRVDLDAERAAEAVNAFVFLATTGFYDGLEVFRHAEGLNVFQTGSGTNQSAFQIGYHLPDELEAAESEGYPPGSVAYANAGPGTSGSQFFFVYGDAFQEIVDDGGLPAIYSRFGMVNEGLDVLQRMAEIPVEGEAPQERIYLETVTIVADGQPLPTAHLPAEAEPTPTPEGDNAEED